MSILITGAAGFIGFSLAQDAASKGKIVYLVDNFTRGQRDDDFENLCALPQCVMLDGDLLDQDFCQKLPFEKVETLYHFAAINGTQNFYDKPYEVIKANFTTLTNVLEAIPENCNLKFIYSSSSEAYAGSVENGPAPIPTPENVPLTIADPSNPRWSYGASKLLAEVALFSYAKASNIIPYIVRFHNIYGPRMGVKHVIPNFVEKILSMKDQVDPQIELMGHDQTRSFCFIDDAINALNIFDEKTIETGIYNIGDPRAEITVEKLFKYCCEIILEGQTIPIIPIAPPKGSVSRRVPDIRKIGNYGYIPKTDLREGLCKTISWYLEKYEDTWTK